MVELFSNFTTTLAVIGILLAAGIIFKKQLISFEDKFDAWWVNHKGKAKTKNNNK